MSKTRVLVWGDFPESADEWHRQHQSDVAAKLSARSYFWECVDNPFAGLVPSLEDPFLSVYEVPDTTDYEEIDRKLRINPQTAPSSVLEEARFDSRCYTEIKRIENDNYNEDKCKLGCLIAVTWRPNEATKDAMFNWFFTEFMPELMTDPLMISTTVYRRTHATIFENGAYRPATEKEAPEYVTVCESTCEELPWDVLVALGQTEGWRKHLDGDTLWQIAQYTLTSGTGIGNDTFKTDATQAGGTGP